MVLVDSSMHGVQSNQQRSVDRKPAPGIRVAIASARCTHPVRVDGCTHRRRSYCAVPQTTASPCGHSGCIRESFIIWGQGRMAVMQRLCCSCGAGGASGPHRYCLVQLERCIFQLPHGEWRAAGGRASIRIPDRDFHDKPGKAWQQLHKIARVIATVCVPAVAERTMHVPAVDA